ncbi:hypothetical protein DBV05_g9960 [Lasiodiplodia theobromae]|uniref:Uncharacterized protein n=1 Tax=Lasiodiplodia theobromae TaxID=45133 RepID=A0A5N5D1X7_9PEZI|nr:hypothetical protein DBV05_g9960 [Lasiodiplodia theobromae]
MHPSSYDERQRRAKPHQAVHCPIPCTLITVLQSFSKLKHAEDNTLAVGAFLKHRHDKVWPTGSAKITPTSKDDDKGYIKRLKARRVLMHPTLDC